MDGIITATHTYKTVDNCPVRLDAYVNPDRNSPVIVYIHGGALIWGSRKEIDPIQLALYLEAGFSVVSIDYRLAPETKLPEIAQDIRDAFTWVRSEFKAIYGIKSGKIAVVGHSAGGYLSLLSGTFDNKPDAIVSFYGYGDIAGDWYTKPSSFYCTKPAVSREQALSCVGTGPLSEGPEERSRFYLYCRQNGLWNEMVAGLGPAADYERLVKYCTAFNIQTDYPPVLLAHGTADTDVPYEQSTLMAEKLRDTGIKHELVTVENGIHGFDEDMESRASKQVFEKVISFLKYHIGSPK